MLIRDGFGFNTNIFETNILNLVVVIRVLVTVVGDAIGTFLDRRRKRILLTLQEADIKAKEAQKSLEDARKEFETANLRAQEIRIQAVQTAEQEVSSVQTQLRKDLSRIKERGNQTIQLERQRAIQSISQQFSEIALTSAENILLKSFGTEYGNSLKQIELNEIHVRKTLSQLKRL